MMTTSAESGWHRLRGQLAGNISAANGVLAIERWGLHYSAVEGLRRLDTPETRKVLWKAGYLVPTKTVG